MIRKMFRETRRALIVVVCLSSMLSVNACCTSLTLRRAFLKCGDFVGGQDCCTLYGGDFCPDVHECSGHQDCSAIVLPCAGPHIESLAPRCIETHDVAVPNVNFTIQGSGLANVDTI